MCRGKVIPGKRTSVSGKIGIRRVPMGNKDCSTLRAAFSPHCAPKNGEDPMRKPDAESPMRAPTPKPCAEALWRTKLRQGCFHLRARMLIAGPAGCLDALAEGAPSGLGARNPGP